MPDVSPDISPADYNRVSRQTEVWFPLITQIAQRTNSDGALNRFKEGSNIVFASGSDRVIKVFPKFLEFQYEAERAALALVHGRVPTSTPKLLCFGSHEGWPYLVISRVQGEPLSSVWDKTSKDEKCAILHELGRLIHAHHDLKIESAFPAPAWEEFIPAQISKCVARHSRLNMPSSLLNEIPNYLESVHSDLPIKLKRPVLLTGEYTPGNILTERSDDALRISGLIDYGDSMVGFHEYDLLGPCTFLAAGDQDLLVALFRGYGYAPKDIDRSLTRRLMALLLLHRYSNLDVQIGIPGWRDADSLSSLEQLIWPVGC